MEVIKNFLYSHKNDILDPLTIIIKLFIYSYKPLGTKLSIWNNKVYIQEATLFQSAIRTIHRDSKNDINIMFLPIIYACEIYLGPIEEGKRERFLLLFQESIKSFDLLIQTYSGNEIIYNLEQLKSIIDSFIKNSEYDPENIISNYNDARYDIKKSIYKQLNLIWTDERIDIIFGFLNEILSLDKNNKDQLDSLLLSLIHYINFIDNICLKRLENL